MKADEPFDPQVDFEFKVTTAVRFRHKKGWTKSDHLFTSIVLEISRNLDLDEYHDKEGNPTDDGVQALTQTLVQGLIGNIHYAHQRGLKNDAEHLRYIIDELGRGFATNAIVQTKPDEDGLL